MAQTVPAKIVLKSTTKMSLNDRFTTIQKMRPPPMNPQEVRAQMAATQQSSQQNRRLAQQMANRPSVQAALNKSQKTLKQRLGPSNIKSRLTLSAVKTQRGGAVRGQRGGGRGFRRPSGRGRGGRGGVVMQSSSMSDLNGATRGRGGRGFRGRGGFRGGRGGSPRWLDDDRRSPRGRGGGRRGFGPRGRDYRSEGQRGARSDGGQGGRGGRGGRGGGRGAGRGGRFQRGRGGRGRGRGGANNFSRDELDNQLEEYMSKTKSHLNSELDAYMAEADQL